MSVASDASVRSPAMQLLAGRMERRLAEAETRGETAAVLATQASAGPELAAILRRDPWHKRLSLA